MVDIFDLDGVVECLVEEVKLRKPAHPLGQMSEEEAVQVVLDEIDIDKSGLAELQNVKVFMARKFHDIFNPCK